MHIIYEALLFTAHFVIFTHCQGAGGGGGGGAAGGGFGGGGGSGSPCITDECQRKQKIILASVLGGCGGLFVLCCGALCCCTYCEKKGWCKGRPLGKNSAIVHVSWSKNNEQVAYDGSPYQSGIWSSRYYQYTGWHGPHQFSLSFDAQSMKVTGSGSDDVGTFTIDGTYSVETNRIGLTKQYQIGTGNRLENFGHQVTIQLTWNDDNHQFEGKWYVQTSTYRGEDKFELKLDEPREQLPTYEQSV